MRWLLVLALLCARAGADPGCPTRETWLYLEPSLYVGGPDGQALHRIAGGLLLRNCTSDGVDHTNARLGLTLAIAGNDFLTGGGAVGIEAEMDHPVAPKFRLGGRVGYESSNGNALLTFGARLHYADTVFFELDGFESRNNSLYADPYGFGSMVGVGFEGKPGAVIAGVEVGVTAVLFLLLVASCSTHSCFGGGT